MVGVFALGVLALGSRYRRLVKQAVGIDHVVHDAALRNLFRLELGLGGKVASIVVTEMVVRGDGQRLDASVHQELGEDRLELGLTGLEVVTTDEGTVALRQFDDTRNEGVLWGSINEGLALEDSGHGEEGRRGNLGMRVLDRVQEVIGGVIHTRENIAVPLGVGRPEDNNTVQIIGGPELANVGTELVEVNLFVIPGN